MTREVESPALGQHIAPTISVEVAAATPFSVSQASSPSAPRSTGPLRRSQGFVTVAMLWCLLCFGAVEARDVDLATWTKPAQGLEVWGALPGDNTGNSVADAGDINKDGYQDVIIGAYAADISGQANAGSAYVVFGTGTRTTSVLDTAGAPGAFKITGAIANDLWGYSVSGIGDFNKDGIDDFVIGGYGFDPPLRTDAGAAVVVFGKTSGWGDIDLASFTSGNAGFWLLGAAAGDTFGFWVSGAGDVNGDGTDDMVVGANRADSQSRSDAGTSYVFFGHSTTTAFNTIDLSAFISGSAGFRICGAAAGDYSGDKVRGAGDVNADGFSDIIIGALFFDKSVGSADSGAAYVIFGHSTASAFTDIDLGSLSGDQGYRIAGAAANDRLGLSVCGAGDFNHDGYYDIVIGSMANKVYVLFGHSNTTAFSDVDVTTFTAGSTGFVVFGSGDLGWSVGGGVDINKDAIDDIVIAASTYSSTGAAYVLYGRAQSVFTNINVLAGLTAVSGFRIVSTASGDCKVSLVGDFDGDGVGDVVVGVSYSDPSGRTDAGTAYLVYGELSTPTSQPTSQPSRQPSARPTNSPVSERSGDVDLATWTKPGQGLEVRGASAGDSAGYRVADAGDVNKDGYRDILVGAINAYFGTVYLMFGSPTRQTSTVDTAAALSSEGIKIVGTGADDAWGISVSGTGDINKDGIDDFIIGGYQFDPLSRIDAGGAVVIFGKTSGWVDIDLASFTSGSAGFWIWGAATGDLCGKAVSGAGDINGDGAADLIVGCDWADPLAKPQAGTSYVIFGHITAFTTIDLSFFNTGNAGFRVFGAAVENYSGNSVSGAGDVDGDGFGDIIVGAPYYDGSSGRTDSGAAYVIFGHGTATAFTDIDLASLTSSSSSQGFRITGAAASNYFGRSVSSAGDFNHDGYGDIVIGSEANKAYVIFGHAYTTAFLNLDLATFVAGTTGFAVSGSGTFGFVVSGGVDVNRDNIDDIVIAAPVYSSTGVAYVLYGRSLLVFTDINVLLGLPSVSGYRIIGAASAGTGSWSVSLVRDFDGDGVGEVLVGTQNANPPGRNGAGAAYLVYGELSAPTSQPSMQPTVLPSRQPSSRPSSQPSWRPTSQPSVQPSRQPTGQPSSRPTSRPSRQPTSRPSAQPSRQPTDQPTRQPSSQPSGQPTSAPTRQPSVQPSWRPSSQPTSVPTAQPSQEPSSQPTVQPSSQPSAQPSTQPTQQPTMQPSRCPSSRPSRQPTAQPSKQPNSTPSAQPSRPPSGAPTAQPSSQPTGFPSAQPSRQPSTQPSRSPTCQPTSQPTDMPSTQPTRQPTSAPSGQPSSGPSAQPTKQPSVQPSCGPSGQPSMQPTRQPTSTPSGQPSCQPSSWPTTQPTKQPSRAPSTQPSQQPTVQPSCAPSCQPTVCPSVKRHVSRVHGRLHSPHNSQRGSRAALPHASRQHYPVHNQRDNQRSNPPEHQVHSLRSNLPDNQVAYRQRSQPRSPVLNPLMFPLHSRATGPQSSPPHSLHISPVLSPLKARPRSRVASRLVSPHANLPTNRATRRPVNQPCSPLLRLLVSRLRNRRASPPAHHLHNLAGSPRSDLPHSPHRPQPKSLCRQPL
jgi:hypothetical protein